MPQRLCGDCAAKLTIAFQFRKDAAKSENVLKGYSEAEKDENDIYENAKYDEEEYFEYETIEELDESSQDVKKVSSFEEVTVASSGGNDAVSFLAGILKPKRNASKAIEVRRQSSKKSQSGDAGFDDPNRKHCCNVCNKKFQKRSNLIDHLRLHANVKVYSCDVRTSRPWISDNLLIMQFYSSSFAKSLLFRPATTKPISEHTQKRNRTLATTATKPTASPVR